jgi:hypothetical protein
MEVLVKTEILTLYIYIYIYIYMDLRLATLKSVSFYLPHNVSTLNQCRKVTLITDGIYFGTLMVKPSRGSRPQPLIGSNRTGLTAVLQTNLPPAPSILGQAACWIDRRWPQRRSVCIYKCAFFVETTYTSLNLMFHDHSKQDYDVTGYDVI